MTCVNEESELHDKDRGTDIQMSTKARATADGKRIMQMTGAIFLTCRLEAGARCM